MRKLFLTFIFSLLVPLLFITPSKAENVNAAPLTDETISYHSTISTYAGFAESLDDIQENCSLEAMKEMYLEDGKAEEQCWYCKIVVVMINAFLQAAKAALPAAISLGEIILQLGFLIWLAYYILQQVSSFAPITIGKMLQEILVMGSKVALAWVCIHYSIDVIREFYINPVFGLGIDYGKAIMDRMMVLSVGVQS